MAIARGSRGSRASRLSLTVANESEAERLFAALGDGGKVQMPLAKTFFSPPFGMVADRFGVLWMIYVARLVVAKRPKEQPWSSLDPYREALVVETATVWPESSNRPLPRPSGPRCRRRLDRPSRPRRPSWNMSGSTRASAGASP